MARSTGTLIVLVAALAALPAAAPLAPFQGTAAQDTLPPGLAAPDLLSWFAPLAPSRSALPPELLEGAPLICILDTGVDTGHVDLDEGKVEAWRDFLHQRPSPYDDNGHGTHVAATAAGTGESGRPGAAPHARLAVGKVMDVKGSGTTRAAVQGIDWCLGLGAKVINTSLEEKDCAGQRSLTDAVRRAAQQGALLVTTAGNRGDAPCSIHSPGAHAEAFTVGALDGPGLDARGVAGYSGRGAEGSAKPDLVAPGTGIRAAQAGTHAGLRTMDGTSMAAPLVAGTAALLFEHTGASAAEVAHALRATARDGGPAGHDNAWGWGAFNPAAALAWLEARPR